MKQMLFIFHLKERLHGNTFCRCNNFSFGLVFEFILDSFHGFLQIFAFQFSVCNGIIGNFIKLLNLTCRLDYRDFDGNTYSEWEEHIRPLQSKINHDYVGSYQLVLLKPFPLRIIEAMKKRIALIDKEEKDKQIADFDKKYSLQDLDEIEERI